MLRVEPKQLDALLHPQFDAAALKTATVDRQGPGGFSRRCLRPGCLHRRGRQSSGPRRARRSFWSAWRPPRRTSKACRWPQGILTVRGGMTSHAAVVARGMGTCCVSGCGEINDGRRQTRRFTLGGKTYQGGRLYLHRRLHRQHLRRSHPDRPKLPISGDFGRFMELGGRVSRS